MNDPSEHGGDQQSQLRSRSTHYERLVLWCCEALARSDSGELEAEEIPGVLLAKAVEDDETEDAAAHEALLEARRRYRQQKLSAEAADKQRSTSERLLDGTETDQWQWVHAVLPAASEHPITPDVVGLARALQVLRIDVRYDVRASEVQWNFARTVFPADYGWTPESGEPWVSGQWHRLEGGAGRELPKGVHYLSEALGDWWVPNSDLIAPSVRQAIEVFFEFETGKRARFTQEQWQNSLDTLSRQAQCDPFEEWVTSLRWDGEPRLETWLEEVFIFSDETPVELVRWGAMQILAGACKRTAQPGSKIDQMVVLCGPQGMRKSTILEHLLPAEHQAEWFSDSYNFMLPEKERIECTLGAVIVEIAEMVGSKREDVARIKNDLSKRVDRARLAYRRDVVKLPRRHIKVGTTNDPHDLPNDPSGLRRFVPLDIVDTKLGVTMKDIIDWFEEPQYQEVRIVSDKDPTIHTTFESLSGSRREQLWAEAWHRRNEEGALYTSGELDGLARAAAEKHRYADHEIEEMLQEFLTSSQGKGGGFRTRKLLSWIRDEHRGVDVSEGRIKRALQHAGWTYRLPTKSDDRPISESRSRGWYPNLNPTGGNPGTPTPDVGDGDGAGAGDGDGDGAGAEF